MDVFVSSLISGMEEDRAAVRRAIERLGHRAVMAEDFGARPNSPQVACLGELRKSDAVVLVLGARYGSKQMSGLSATHEEYRSAQGQNPVIIFLKDGDTGPEPDQAAFIAEVSGWEGGLFRDSYSEPEQLFDVRAGADVALVDHAVSVFQGERHGPTAEVQLWPTGDLRVSVPLPRSAGSHMSYVVEEDVAETVADALAFAGWVLGQVDPTERLTHVSVAARVVGDSVMGWRTAAEQAASPNSGSWSMMSREGERGQPVQLSPAHMPRAALTMRSREITEDLVVMLRRRWSDERYGR